MNKTKARFTLLFWIGIILILTANVFLWLYVNRLEGRFQEQLRLRLLSTSRALDRQIDGDALNRIVPGNSFSLDYIALLTTLQTFQQQDSLQSIILFSASGEVLVSAPEVLTQQQTTLPGDTLFRRAYDGETVVSEPREIAGNWLMSVLRPVFDSNGFIVAVQVIEARADYFETLEELRRQLLLYSLITLVLIILVAVYLYRLINRTMAYQAEIKDREHLVELGTMAASVAHELRNPLGIIEGTNELIRKKYGRQEDELFGYIPDEVRRLSVLIENFLNFARTPQIRTEQVNADLLLQKIIAGYPAQRQEQIHLQQTEKAPVIESDPALLEQVFLNITRNALDAVDPVKGQLDIKTEQHSNRLLLYFCDNGDGVPEENRASIFRPFFTTREKGTGLGLAISRRLARLLGGDIRYTARPEGGSCFIVELPVRYPGNTNGND